MNIKNAKIYCLYDVRTFEIRYIGSTIRTLRNRRTAHIGQAKVWANYKPNETHKWINNIGKSNVGIFKLDECDPRNRLVVEQFYIDSMKATGAQLTNAWNTTGTQQ